MFFVLSKLFIAVIAHGNFVVLALVVGVGLQHWGGPRGRHWGKKITVFMTVILVGLVLLPVDVWLGQPLERRFPIPSLPARVDGIIVLGGMTEPSVTSVWGQPKLNHAANRATEFVHLARRYPDARLVFSGGSGSILEADLPEAPVAREIFSRLGIPPERVLFEGQSRNTYENAQFSRASVHPKDGETWILITSAVHMARAVGVFRQQGWRVLPYPVAFFSGRNDEWPPSLDFAKTSFRLDEILHEWVGLIVYYLTGRISDLFPGPESEG
ncbi:DUF218 domain-containing protein [Gammaproteobacteria bacterium]